MLNFKFRFFAVISLTCLSLSSFAQEMMVHFQQHTVKDGETVESITQQYNIDQMDFLLLNDFPTTINLQPGTVVLIKIINDEEFDQLALADPSSVSGFHESKPIVDLSPPTDKKTEPKPVVEQEPEPEPQPEPAPAVANRKRSTNDIEYGPRGTAYHVSRTAYHVVELNQTCYRIALIYGMNLEYLMELKNMHSYLIFPGQQLRV